MRLIENYLLKKVRTTDDVKKLNGQINKRSSFMRHLASSNIESLDALKKKVPEAERDTLQQCVDMIADFADECVDQSAFEEQKKDFTEELCSAIEGEIEQGAKMSE